MSKSLRPSVALAVLEVGYQQVVDCVGSLEQQINELTHGCDCFVDQQRELIEQLTGHYPPPNDSLAYHDTIEARIRELLTQNRLRASMIRDMVRVGDLMAEDLSSELPARCKQWESVRVEIKGDDGRVYGEEQVSSFGAIPIAPGRDALRAALGELQDEARQYEPIDIDLRERINDAVRDPLCTPSMRTLLNRLRDRILTPTVLPTSRDLKHALATVEDVQKDAFESPLQAAIEILCDFVRTHHHVLELCEARRIRVEKFVALLTTKDTKIAELTDQVEKYCHECEHKDTRIGQLEDVMDALRKDLLDADASKRMLQVGCEEYVRQYRELARVGGVNPDSEQLHRDLKERFRLLHAERDAQFVVVRLAALLGVERNEGAITGKITEMLGRARLETAMKGDFDPAMLREPTLSVHKYSPEPGAVEGADCAECELPPGHPIHDHASGE